MPYRRGKAYSVRVPRRHGEAVRKGAGTTDRATATAIEAAMKTLAARREWALLESVTEGSRQAKDLFDAYMAGGEALNKFRENLSDVDVAPLVETFAAALAKRTSADTIAHYVAAVRTLIPEGRPFPSSNLTRGRLQEWLDGKETLSRSTIFKHAVGMRRFCDWLTRRGVLASNPMQGVDVPTPAPPRCRYLESEDECRQLADRQPRMYRAFSALLHGTGLDVSTALDLRRRDVNETARTIEARGTKTWNRQRKVRVANWCWPYLAEILEGRHPNARLFEEIPNRWAPREFHDEAIAKLVEEGHRGFAGYWMRDARHTWAVRAALACVPLQAIGRQLGHRDAMLVAKVYGRFVPLDSEMDHYEELASAADARRRSASAAPEGREPTPLALAR